MNITRQTLALRDRYKTLLADWYLRLSSREGDIEQGTYDSLINKYNDANSSFRDFNRNILNYQNDNEGALEKLESVFEKMKVFNNAWAASNSSSRPVRQESATTQYKKGSGMAGYLAFLIAIPAAFFLFKKK